MQNGFEQKRVITKQQMNHKKNKITWQKGNQKKK